MDLDLKLDEGIQDEEFDLYKQLTSEAGYSCDINDPELEDPLSTTLHVEHRFAHDLELRVECEDSSLNFHRPVSRLRMRLRDGAPTDLVLVDSPNDMDIVTLVLTDEAEQQLLALVLHRLSKNPHAYRTAKPVLGCLPVACLSGCLGRGQRQQATGASAPGGSRQTPDEEASSPLASGSGSAGDDSMGMAGSHSPGSTRVHRKLSFASMRHGGSKHHLHGHGAPPQQRDQLAQELAEVRALARQLWDQALERERANVGTRSTSGIGGARLKKSGSLVGMMTESPSRTSGSRQGDAAESRLNKAVCGDVLLRVVSLDDYHSPQVVPPGVSDLFIPEDPTRQLVDFEEFWCLCRNLLVVDKVGQEPELQKSFGSKEGHTMSASELGWFLVQLQDAPKAVVEASAEHLASKRGSPDVAEIDGLPHLTLYGLTRHLCSERENCLLEPSPSVGEASQDMSRPLSEYWIATAHHVHADARAISPQRLRSPRTSFASQGAATDVMDESKPLGPTVEPLWSIRASLDAGCRCLGLALVTGSSQRGSSGFSAGASAAEAELHVLLQQRRVPLVDVLELIKECGFQMRPAFPLLLVLSLALLPPSACAVAAEVVRDVLQDRLWRNAGAELPSPQDAIDHVILILSPGAAAPEVANADPALRPPATAVVAPGKRPAPMGSPDSEAEGVARWQQASKSFAVWAGHAFNPSFPHKSPLEIGIGFLRSDDLRALEETKTQQLIEYHRQYLTMAFPAAPRQALANFNPASAWAVGIQMAAVMLGGTDLGGGAVLAHMGRFAQSNGGCGYVLKPPHLRPMRVAAEEEEDGAEDATTAEQAEASRLVIDLRILAARAVPGSGQKVRPEGPTEVSVSVWGLHGDTARRSYKPVRAPSVGWVIEWPEGKSERNEKGESQTMRFDIGSPSTAVIVFEVVERDEELGRSCCVAAFAAPVAALRPGLRWVPLWEPKGRPRAMPTRFGQLSGLLVYSRFTKVERRKLARSRTKKGHF